MTMEVGGVEEIFRCVKPEPKVKEMSVNNELACQAVQAVSEYAAKNVKYLKWSMFIGLRPRIRGIRVRKQGIIKRQLVNQLVGLKKTGRVLVLETLCKYHYGGVMYNLGRKF
ncbi:hypothetical protein PVK06_047383 [Gossypium arboreum]|uniref:Uncharacterized protein n=1 Tax=Gossypium arboreum TaxID=29729 RepID=A0ABR0MFQ9_GOSAR|nr:hypothetical protein PVK06_047383 [Gossypium arboreum]